MKIFEIIGAAIIFLVVIAFARTPEFFQTGFDQSWLIVLLLAIVVLIGVTTIARAFFTISSNILFVLGLIFMVGGSFVFFFFSDFLFAGLQLEMSIWHKISFYTLPSICVEGGIATLLISFLNKEGVVASAREKIIVAGFLVYALVAISISFMTVFGIISVDHHIQISRILIPVILAISCLRFLKK